MIWCFRGRIQKRGQSQLFWRLQFGSVSRLWSAAWCSQAWDHGAQFQCHVGTWQNTTIYVLSFWIVARYSIFCRGLNLLRFHMNRTNSLNNYRNHCFRRRCQNSWKLSKTWWKSCLMTLHSNFPSPGAHTPHLRRLHTASRMIHTRNSSPCWIAVFLSNLKFR